MDRERQLIVGLSVVVGATIFFPRHLLPALAAVIAGYALVDLGLMIAAGREVYLRRPEWDAEGSSRGGVPAKRLYFYGQAVRDLRRFLRWSAERILGSFARHLGGRWGRDFGPPGRALGALALGGVVIGVLGGVAVAALAATAAAACVLIAQTATRLAASTLRLADEVWKRSRGITITCPACFRRPAFPAYHCPNKDDPDEPCERRHLDVRPGPYGILHRTCSCSARMPTLLISGAHRLQAFCPYCEHLLADHAGTTRELIVATFGTAGAGTTRLLISLLGALHGEDGLRLSPADDETRAAFKRVERLWEGKDQTPVTTTAAPRAASYYLATDRRRMLLHLFDASGTRFSRSEPLRELPYFRLAPAFLFVLDACTDGLHPSPDLVFHQTAQHLEELGVPCGRRRLGVVITKRDLLERSRDFPAGADEQAAERWLAAQWPFGNLLRAMRYAFREVRFFTTAAPTEREGAADGGVAAVTRWLVLQPLQRR